MQSLAGFALMAAATTTAQPLGQPPNCQGAPAMVDPWVRDNFDIAMMEGTYYELAFHDWTQPRDICKCHRSIKRSFPAGADHDAYIVDHVSMNCVTQDYQVDLSFNTTDKPALLAGKCPYFAPIFGTNTCPDYIIDVGTREVGKPYPWVIEFQCVEGRFGNLGFAGINFYARDKSEATLMEMKAAAEKHNLQEFWDGGFPSGLYIVNHTDCTYPDPPEF